MTRTLKRIVYVLLGIAAGGIIWFSLESIMLIDGGTFRLRIIIQGALIGGIYGGVLGIGEGIALSIRKRALKGALFGFLFGIPAGVAAVLFAQSILLFLTGSGSASLHDITTGHLPLAKALGWTVMGGIIGAVEGLRAGSFRRALFGIAGAAIGGILGGAALELLNTPGMTSSLGRLFGFILLGGFLGAGLSLSESLGRFGTVKVMNGKFKGKEFLLVKGNISVGSNDSCDIPLPADAEAEAVHARIYRRDKAMFIERKSEKAPLVVNDHPITESRLKYEDVIRCGKTVLRFLP